jgi:hypothetical protein
MSRILYGCVAVLTVLASLGEDPERPLQDMLMVWIALAGIGLSHFWSEIIVKEAMLRHKAHWPEIADALRHSLWVLPAALAPTATFLLFANRQVSRKLRRRSGRVGARLWHRAASRARPLKLRP